MIAMVPKVAYLVIEFCCSECCGLLLTNICDNCLLTRDVNPTASGFRIVSVQGSVNVTLHECYSAKAIIFFCSKLHLEKVLHLGLQHNKQSVLLNKILRSDFLLKIILETDFYSFIKCDFVVTNQKQNFSVKTGSFQKLVNLACFDSNCIYLHKLFSALEIHYVLF